MSVVEMKKTINEKVEKLNGQQLAEVDIFITRINNISFNEWGLNDHVKNIVNERDEVLKKLAK